MDRYTYRGKRIDTGDWIYGFLYIAHTGEYEIGRYDSTVNIERITYVVDPATVGQYTGLKDKNDKRIFEGDIISLITEDGELITIECKFGKVQRQIYEHLVEITGFYFERSNDGRKTFPIVNNYLRKHDTEIWEVIGTIHDAPKGE